MLLDISLPLPWSLDFVQSSILNISASIAFWNIQSVGWKTIGSWLFRGNSVLLCGYGTWQPMNQMMVDDQSRARMGKWNACCFTVIDHWSAFSYRNPRRWMISMFDRGGGFWQHDHATANSVVKGSRCFKFFRFKASGIWGWTGWIMKFHVLSWCIRLF